MSLAFESLIEIKRDGGTHTAEQLRALVDSYVSGETPDYQMAAWLMAAYLRGLDAEETIWLTDAMARSGRTIDLSGIPGIKVDKHSTGGVGDTTSLVLAPLVAACGVPVAKMSGRGLGHTGGTLDKLESIPGFRVTMSVEEFIAQVADVGIAIVAQSPEVDPADKKMYALRDVTATVPSIPLIVGSVLSKKIAGGADAILLDVKFGSGAFMKTVDSARSLASQLQSTGRALGRDVSCVLSDMDVPLGDAVGNSVEVIEAIHTLRGEIGGRLLSLCIALAAKMLVLGAAAADEAEGARKAVRAIEDGSALEAFRRWVAAQGGDPRVADDTTLLPLATCVRSVLSAESGYVTGFDAEGVGRAAMVLGAGRETVDASVDYGAGLVLSVREGDRVEAGDELARLYAKSEALLDAGERLYRESVRIGAEVPAPCPLFMDASA